MVSSVENEGTWSIHDGFATHFSMFTAGYHLFLAHDLPWVAPPQGPKNSSRGCRNAESSPSSGPSMGKKHGWTSRTKKTDMAVCQNPCTPSVHIKIAGKWMFIPLKMVLRGIDPYPYQATAFFGDCQTIYTHLYFVSPFVDYCIGVFRSKTPAMDCGILNKYSVTGLWYPGYPHEP